MLHHNNGAACVGGCAQQAHDRVRRGGVQIGGRFVQQKHLGLRGEGAGQHRTPGLAARHAIHARRAQCLDTANLQSAGYRGRRPVAMRDAAERGHLLDGQPPG